MRVTGVPSLWDNDENENGKGNEAGKERERERPRGVLRRLASEQIGDGFPTPTYELRLADAGIEVADPAGSWTAP